MAMLVDTRSPWERNLLLDLQLIQHEDAIWEALSSQCFVATDGSAPQGKGSFAWTLSTAKGDRLARCSGPVFGHAISSYRAEGYGILSFLRFLLHMTKLHWKPGDTIHSPHLVCDNKGMIQTVT